jgi:hypothetical protein
MRAFWVRVSDRNANRKAAAMSEQPKANAVVKTLVVRAQA